jgi:hypothetical protein
MQSNLMRSTQAVVSTPFDIMIELPKTASEVSVEPKDEIAESSIASPSDELDDDESEIQSGFRPSKTLLVALFLLTLTFGVAGYAGFTLWSLSDHSASSEEPTTTQEEGSLTLP